MYIFNPDCAVCIVARVEKPQRNAKLKRFFTEGIVQHILRNEIVKQGLQHVL